MGVQLYRDFEATISLLLFILETLPLALLLFPLILTVIRDAFVKHIIRLQKFIHISSAGCLKIQIRQTVVVWVFYRSRGNFFSRLHCRSKYTQI